jgi:hypothetical protein
MMHCVRGLASVAVSGFLILGCGGDSNAPLVATQVAFETQPLPTVSSAQSLGNVTVRILTASGQTASATKYQVVLGLSAPSDTVQYPYLNPYPRLAADSAWYLAGTTTIETTTGVASFPNLSIARAGAPFNLVARVTGLDIAVSQPFTVTPGPASQLRFNLITQSLVGYEAPVVVRIADAAGNIVTSANDSITVGYTRTGSFGFTIALNDAFGPVTTTAVNGVATVHGLTFHKSGTYSLSASAAGLPPATLSYNFTVPGWQMSRLIFATPPSDGTAGIPLATFSVTQADSYGNGPPPPHSPGNPWTVTLSLGSNPSGAALGGTRSATSGFGATSVSFQDITIDKPGTGYTLVATYGSWSATSAPFDIK